MENIAIVGGGSWGSALANLLEDNNKNVLIYDNDLKTINEINQFHTNKSKLGDVKLSEKIEASNDLDYVLSHSELIVLAVPTSVTRLVLEEINPLLKEAKLFCNVAKGLEFKTNKRVSEIVYDVIDNNLIKGFVSLTGPSHAEEVVVRKLTSVVAASENLKHAELIQEIFSNTDYFRVYTSQDLIGAELGGSLKNIYAIASGMLDGLGYGINTKAALITRGLIEMKRIATELGALEETLNGLVGIGDLIVTCMSKFSRNYSAGLMIGEGDNLKTSLSKMTMVVEGVKTCKTAYFLAKELKIQTPIINAVYNVLFNEIEPEIEIAKLMARDLKSEQ
ncbi:MAG: NAD(P)-dependent glycerol-3-phosphate dehydrogenase [Candidatus Izimaplasma sp.]|nr:NAD(P)-dependent glycerol-3-phosphate dehydrogenase [Candidatus Izimaplasma bacterium]